MQGQGDAQAQVDAAPPEQQDQQQAEQQDEQQADEEEEEDEEAYSSESDEEPRLKYQRVGLSVTAILRRDSASAVAVCSQFMVLGTHTGAVYICDLNGQEISSYHAHSATINAISIDTDSQFTATASDDGLVHIRSIDGRAAPATFAYTRPILGISLDPLYGRSNNGRFASGGRAGELVLKQKGWLGTKDIVLQKGEGPIYAVSWHGTLIAWANSRGVKLYDAASSQRISHIERPAGSPDPELHRCILCWEDNVTLTIGWGNSIQVITLLCHCCLHTAATCTLLPAAATCTLPLLPSAHRSSTPQQRSTGAAW